MGLLRRAMLAAGNMLFPTHPELALETIIDELTTLVATSEDFNLPSTAAILRQRDQSKRQTSIARCPRTESTAQAVRPTGLQVAARVLSASDGP